MKKITITTSIIVLLCSIIALYSVIRLTNFDTDKLLVLTSIRLLPETKKQVDCLTDNIYFESGFEPEHGKVAVALVTMNRVQDPRYPRDICSVVKQKTKSTCQFSWFCEGSKTIDRRAYEKSREIALHVYANYERMTDFTDGALFYHADYVNPGWKGLQKTVVIGRHIFYKERE